MISIPIRPRRNRKSESLRSLVRETHLSPSNLVLPLFVQDGKAMQSPVASMPGVFRLSPDLVVREAEEAWRLGIRAVALFPCISDWLKDKKAGESKNPRGLIPTTLHMLKEKLDRMTVITDVAMDPYSEDGHDGLYDNGEIKNDATLPILAEMALTQAKAGADLVAPSDMMDGRVAYIRKHLDDKGMTQTGILSYAVKYCSSLYGPFRDALHSAPKSGDKKTYQMDPANLREAIREAELDVQEGADIIMIKPALAYLDVIRKIRDAVSVPVAAYQVSGEYSMIRAAGLQQWIDEKAVMMESLLAVKRAGADILFTYFAKEAAKLLGN